MEEIYEPREDSFMLAEQVKKYAKGIVLDVGTGSGIQAITAAKKKNVKLVVGLDKSEKAINYCKNNVKNKKIIFVQSDLFASLKESIIKKILKILKNRRFLGHKKSFGFFREIKNGFDTVIFNPPYLPEDIKLKDMTIHGGKKGYEIVERFLSEVNEHLKPDGIILLLFSSLTKKDKVDEFIRNNLLESKLLSKKHIFFEDLFVYLIKKSELLKKLEKKGIKNPKYFTKGHRGILFACNYKGKKAVIKAKLPESKAVGRMENEGIWLNVLNKHKIGPKLFLANKDFFVYEYVPGPFILQHFKKSGKKSIIKIIKAVFEQMFILDKLKVDKEEMHHPYKHVIITKNKPVLVDFERCHKTQKPKNVTQFCQCVISMSKINKNIKINKNKIIKLAKQYKKNINKTNLNNIKNELSG